MAILSQNGSFVLAAYYYNSVSRTLAACERTQFDVNKMISQKRWSCLATQNKLVDCQILVTPVKSILWRWVYYSNFKLDVIWVRWVVILRNSNSIKLVILEKFKPKLGKLVTKFKLKLERLVFLKLDRCFELKVFKQMKLNFLDMESHE